MLYNVSSNSSVQNLTMENIKAVSIAISIKVYT